MMAYSGFILLITSIGICYAAASKAGAAFNFFELALSAVDLALSINDMLKADKLQEQLESLKAELLAKLEEVKTSVEQLRQAVTQLIRELKLQIRMQKVEDFELSTKNRLQDIENMIAATPNEQTQYWRIFLDDLDAYVRETRAVLSHVTSRSIGSESLLQLVKDKTNCHMTEMQGFTNYVRNLVLSGISIETLYKINEHNLSLEIEKAYWEAELLSFDAAVDALFDECRGLFPELYLKDITTKYDSLEILHTNLVKRYTDKAFFVIYPNYHDILVSNDSASSFKCVYQDTYCDKKICFLYQDKGTNCEGKVALRMNRDGMSSYSYEISDDFPAMYARNLVLNTDFLIPIECTTWKQSSDPFSKPSEAQTNYRLQGLPPTCSSILCRSEKRTIFMVLLFFALAT